MLLYIPIQKMIRYGVLLLWLPVRLSAQAPADPRSQRDAEVLRTVLAEYFKEANPDKQRFRVSTQRADVSYFAGFGLLIAAPAYVPSGGWNGMGVNQFTFTTPDGDEDEEEPEKHRPAPPRMPENEQVAAVMKQFVGNYGSLMNFLQPNEKVLFYYDKKPDRLYQVGAGGDVAAGKSDKAVRPERILMEIAAADLRLPAADLAAKVKTAVLPLEKNTRPEFEIMGKVYYSTFEPATGGRFVGGPGRFAYFDGMEGSPAKVRYEYFKGLGIIYSFTANYTGSRNLRTVRGDVLMNHPGPIDIDIDLARENALRQSLNEEEMKRLEKEMKRVEIDARQMEKEAEAIGRKAERDAMHQKRRQHVRIYRNESSATADDDTYMPTPPAPPMPPDPPTPPVVIDIEENVVVEHDRKQADKNKQKNKAAKTPAAPPAPPARATQEAAARAADDYAAFVKAVKEYLIEYGRTLRSLAPDERVVVSVALNAWQASALPGRVELSVPKSVLDEYDRRGLTLEQAAAKIAVREYAKAGQARMSAPRIQFFQMED